eukprot:3286059-Prorocentrum_lima.AAC.1
MYDGTDQWAFNPCGARDPTAFHHELLRPRQPVLLPMVGLMTVSAALGAMRSFDGVLHAGQL